MLISNEKTSSSRFQTVGKSSVTMFRSFEATAKEASFVRFTQCWLATRECLRVEFLRHPLFLLIRIGRQHMQPSLWGPTGPQHRLAMDGFGFINACRGEGQVVTAKRAQQHNHEVGGGGGGGYGLWFVPIQIPQRSVRGLHDLPYIVVFTRCLNDV